MSQNDKAQSKRSYGVGTPYLSFPKTLELAEAIYRAGGEDGSIDVIIKISGNSSNSSSFTKKILALKGFGLIEVSKQKYAFSSLARRMFHPQSPQEKSSAIQESFSKNEILNKIWDKYKGSHLPQREYLANAILNFGIPKNLTMGWADYFLEAAQLANILHERETGSFMVLLQATPKSDNIETFDEADNQSEVIAQSSPSESSDRGKVRVITASSEGTMMIPLKGGRCIVIPKDLTEKEVAYFETWFNSWKTLEE